MRSTRMLSILALLGLLLSGLLATPPQATAQAEACFQETGFCVRGRFLDYWEQNGGLARNGYPLSDERREILEDGNTYTVQYFERVRLEYHPENQSPWDVLLGQFGRRVLLTGLGRDANLYTRSVQPRAGAVYFPETGHNVSGRFLDYWLANGGLAQFGYPLTEEGIVPLEEAGQYTVQYFERARFEYHPEYAGTPYDILLGQFGRRVLAEANLLAGDPGFTLVYVTNERVQELLGAPTDTAARADGAYQTFERGAMLYQGDVRRIYVFPGAQRPGTLLAGGVTSFNDTWREGEDSGGGSGPASGLFLPRLGFSKVWRENVWVRETLGYATTPNETTYTLRVQQFARGQLLSATTATGRFVYAVSFDFRRGSTYDRYPDPSP